MAAARCTDAAVQIGPSGLCKSKSMYGYTDLIFGITHLLGIRFETSPISGSGAGQTVRRINSSSLP